MQTVAKNSQTMRHSSVMVVYCSSPKVWRGFVVPFDISYEGTSKKEVVNALREMTDSYIEGLKKYNNPSHLSAVPLSQPTDIQKWSEVAMQVILNLQQDISKISGMAISSC